VRARVKHRSLTGDARVCDDVASHAACGAARTHGTTTQAVVQEALRRLMAGRTVLVVAHRLSTIVDSHRICVVSGGQLAEQGSHEELCVAGGLYAGLVSRQLAASSASADGAGGRSSEDASGTLSSSVSSLEGSSGCAGGGAGGAPLPQAGGSDAAGHRSSGETGGGDGGSSRQT
jgi:hypothetical protein